MIIWGHRIEAAIVFVAATFFTVACAVALPGAQQATFRAGTDTVSVYATIVDRSGRLVPNLTKDDFQVFDNGVPQTLTVFKNEIQPITIVVMLDRSASMASNFDIVRSAAERFCESFHLPTRRATGISTPTIAPSIFSTYSAGASLTCHGSARPRSC